MTSKDDPIYPVPGTLCEGITKREHFASLLFAALLSGPNAVKHGDLEATANQAVTAANFLITILNSRHE